MKRFSKNCEKNLGIFSINYFQKIKLFKNLHKFWRNFREIVEHVLKRLRKFKFDFEALFFRPKKKNPTHRPNEYMYW